MGKKIAKVAYIIFILVILFIISCPIVNNITARFVISDVKSVPLPPNTQVAEQFSRAGKIVGDGNGMQYLGVVLMESDLSLEELDQYYSSYREAEWEYIVEVQDTQNVDTLENVHCDPYTLKTDISTGQYYIVYSWGSGISPFRDLDLRGH